ncbi:hypothetical protein BC936DRAFT_146079 [Jimgerdemannia flammicorona]|uniref:NmrA-like domain-containing protein n=1 Tax=Jimgerdemannia flammicorona TaxID=994334 RepID=A0A433DLR5_9FUNG|nr:hypothetical protein BC936DRAFT_146079 [Jimgerdemannia flammicorona]
MSSKPLAAILGSTGNQGQVSTCYRTHNVDSETSKSLIAQGAEMVKANLNNRDDIKRAFQGANIVAVVTRRLSSLPDTNAGSNGVLKHMVHWNGKYQVEQYIRKLGILAMFLYLGFYMEIPIPFVTKNTPIDFVHPKGRRAHRGTHPGGQGGVARQSGSRCWRADNVRRGTS